MGPEFMHKDKLLWVEIKQAIKQSSSSYQKLQYFFNFLYSQASIYSKHNTPCSLKSLHFIRLNYKMVAKESSFKWYQSTVVVFAVPALWLSTLISTFLYYDLYCPKQALARSCLFLSGCRVYLWRVVDVAILIQTTSIAWSWSGWGARLLAS